MTKTRRDWEQVADGAARLHVPGGWLYYVKSQGYGGSAAACFVPDVNAGKTSWRNASIDELDLPVRAHRCLVSDCIETVGQLMNKTDAELLRTPNFGHKSLSDIRKALEEFWRREGIDEQITKQAASNGPGVG